MREYDCGAFGHYRRYCTFQAKEEICMGPLSPPESVNRSCAGYRSPIEFDHVRLVGISSWNADKEEFE